MTKHAIKIARAQRIARHTPAVERAVWASISPALVESLTAAQLAEVARCLDAHWHKAQAEAAAGAVAQGAVWSARDQRHIELRA